MMRMDDNQIEPILENEPHALIAFIVSLSRFAVCEGVLSWNNKTLCCLYPYSGRFSSNIFTVGSNHY